MNKMNCVLVMLVAGSSFVAGILHGQTKITAKSDQTHAFSNQAEGSTNLVDYDVQHDATGRLTRLWLALYTDPKRMFVLAPGEQTAIPQAAQTVYEDLNGDSVLDTMVQSGPNGTRSYILYRNSWVLVGTYMSGFEIGRPVFSFDRKTKYIFVNNQWQIAA